MDNQIVLSTQHRGVGFVTEMRKNEILKVHLLKHSISKTKSFKAFISQVKFKKYQMLYMS